MKRNVKKGEKSANDGPVDPMFKTTRAVIRQVADQSIHRLKDGFPTDTSTPLNRRRKQMYPNKLVVSVVMKRRPIADSVQLFVIRIERNDKRRCVMMRQEVQGCAFVHFKK
jgi:hypothetical protein